MKIASEGFLSIFFAHITLGSTFHKFLKALRDFLLFLFKLAQLYRTYEKSAAWILQRGKSFAENVTDED